MCDWVIDSGATHHVTCCKDVLKDIKSVDSQGIQGVHVPTGNKSKITHTGNTAILENKTVKNMLYVLDFKFNLLNHIQTMQKYQIQNQQPIQRKHRLKNYHIKNILYLYCALENLVGLPNLLFGSFLEFTEPKSFKESCLDKAWVEAMEKETKRSTCACLKDSTSMGAEGMQTAEIFVWVKKASRQWNIKLTGTLLAAGYAQSPYDFSLFTKRAGSTIAAKQILHSSFKVKDLEALRYILRIEVLRSNKGVLLTQRKYALQLISDVGLAAAKPINIPVELNKKLTTIDYDTYVGHTRDAELEDVGSYQRLIGKLFYLTVTRQDLCFVVQGVQTLGDQ
ncbi:uncharacterized protein [Nicotiana sylvestris]|uniref:uncharacterized protein n=1 Tax=Nicotiana sylvestris TaxID=4096 RepID=UPI00388CCBE4